MTVTMHDTETINIKWDLKKNEIATLEDQKGN